MLRSTASIVLLPLLSGVAAARLLPSTAARAAPACPSVGIRSGWPSYSTADGIHQPAVPGPTTCPVTGDSP